MFTQSIHLAQITTTAIEKKKHYKRELLSGIASRKSVFGRFDLLVLLQCLRLSECISFLRIVFFFCCILSSPFYVILENCAATKSEKLLQILFPVRLNKWNILFLRWFTKYCVEYSRLLLYAALSCLVHNIASMYSCTAFLSHDTCVYYLVYVLWYVEWKNRKIGADAEGFHIHVIRICFHPKMENIFFFFFIYLSRFHQHRNDIVTWIWMMYLFCFFLYNTTITLFIVFVTFHFIIVSMSVERVVYSTHKEILDESDDAKSPQMDE